MDTTQRIAIWAKLPDEIRDLLTSDEAIDKIKNIAARQGLEDMEQGFLVRICANLMMGILAPADFVNTISTELDLPRDKAAYIAQEVNRDVFSAVKDSLKEIHTKTDDAMLIDPKLVTCLPEQIVPGGIPSGNVARPTQPQGSILEQKLGGTFRIQSEVAQSTAGSPDPMLIVPPAPQRTVPAASSSDPYRELPST